jgi:3-isopropylmalate/(R)-2-methylmalate dehydratase large subunit
MGTLIEEIFSKKLEREVKSGEIVMCELDYIMSHDNTTPIAIKVFNDINKSIKDKNKIVVHFDHAYPAPNLTVANNQKKIRDFLNKHDITNFYHEGICHQVMIEKGFVKPGNVIIGGDSHTNTYGAFCCLGSGFGSTEIGVSWITGKTWFKVPETINIIMTGNLKKGVYAKDVMLYIAGKLGMDGATYKILEFSGSFIQNLAMHDRIIFSNMSTELGAKAGLIASDDITINFLENETDAKGAFEKIIPISPDYEKEIEIDVSKISPQVACHPTVDNVKSINEVKGILIDEVFIGTCTNGRYEDLEIVANILKGKKVHKNTRTIITPASLEVYKKALKNGLIDIFNETGCSVTVVGCGACIGRRGGVLADNEKAFTTMNRNFIGRMGSPHSEIYLGSPAAAALTAIYGKITNPIDHLDELGESNE